MGWIREPPSNSDSPPLFSFTASITGSSVPNATTRARMARTRTVRNAVRLYVGNAQRLEEQLRGRPPPPANWTIPNPRRWRGLERFYSYQPRGFGRVILDRTGTSEHFPIEIDDSEGDTAQNPIVVEDGDSDTDDGDSDHGDTDHGDPDDGDSESSEAEDNDTGSNTDPDNGDTDDDADRDPSAQGVGEAPEET